MRISDWSSDVYSSDLAAQRIEEIVPAALQEAIDSRPGITQVVENIVYAVLRRIGHECVVTRGDRLQKSAIDRIVEGIHAAVIAFPGIVRVWVRYAGTAGGQCCGAQQAAYPSKPLAGQRCGRSGYGVSVGRRQT